jgi:hypothetical protein
MPIEATMLWAVEPIRTLTSNVIRYEPYAGDVGIACETTEVAVEATEPDVTGVGYQEVVALATAPRGSAVVDVVVTSVALAGIAVPLTVARSGAEVMPVGNVVDADVTKVPLAGIEVPLTEVTWGSAVVAEFNRVAPARIVGATA